MQRFTNLSVWKRAHELALMVYRASRTFPADERYGLTSQLRRAAVSVAANIAEGSKRTSQMEFARFLNISESSLAEVQYFLLLARDLEFLPSPEFRELTEKTEDLAPMLCALRLRVEKRPRPLGRTS